MRERWSEDLHGVMNLAAAAAQVRRQQAVGPGHVLLVLLDGPDDRALAVLRLLGVPLEDVRDKLLSALPAVAGEPHADELPPPDPALRRVQELMLREALALGDTRLHTGHLLLSLVREPEHLAGALLLGQGVDHDVAVRLVQEMYQHSATTPRTSEGVQARLLTRLDQMSRELAELRHHLPQPIPRHGNSDRQVAYIVQSQDNDVLLVIAQVAATDASSRVLHLPDQQRAVDAVLEDLRAHPPRSAVCLIDGQVRTVEDLQDDPRRASSSQAS